MPDLENSIFQPPLHASGDADSREAPPATHQGELYEVIGPAFGAGAHVIRCREEDVFIVLVNPEEREILARLVHCRNLVDGPEEYADRIAAGPEGRMERDLVEIGRELDERLARRIAERVEAWMDAKYANTELPLEEGPRADLLAICREQIARWAEPPLQDAPPARPDGSVGSGIPLPMDCPSCRRLYGHAPHPAYITTHHPECEHRDRERG